MVSRLDVQAPRGDPPKTVAGDLELTGLDFDQDPRDPAPQTGEVLQVPERCERDRGAVQRADVVVIDRRDRHRALASVELQARLVAKAHADHATDGLGHGKGPLLRGVVGGEPLQQRSPEPHDPRVGTEHGDPTAPFRADEVRLHLQNGGSVSHTGQIVHSVMGLLREPVGAPGDKLQLAVADNPAGELLHRTGEARARDLRREQQRHADGDADHRQQLLRPPVAQPHEVEPKDAAVADPPPPRWLPEVAHDDGAIDPGCVADSTPFSRV